jgi:hypothetical protein
MQFEHEAFIKEREAFEKEAAEIKSKAAVHDKLQISLTEEKLRAKYEQEALRKELEAVSDK